MIFVVYIVILIYIEIYNVYRRCLQLSSQVRNIQTPAYREIYNNKGVPIRKNTNNTKPRNSEINSNKRKKRS
jgi:hypothetical protein